MTGQYNSARKRLVQLAVLSGWHYQNKSYPVVVIDCDSSIILSFSKFFFSKAEIPTLDVESGDSRFYFPPPRLSTAPLPPTPPGFILEHGLAGFKPFIASYCLNCLSLLCLSHHLQTSWILLWAFSVAQNVQKGTPKITEGGPFDPHWPISRINLAPPSPPPTLPPN